MSFGAALFDGTVYVRLQTTGIHGSYTGDGNRVSNVHNDLAQNLDLACFLAKGIIHASCKSSSGGYASI